MTARLRTPWPLLALALAACAASSADPSPATLRKERIESWQKLCEDRGWPVIPAYIGLGFPLRGEAVGVNLYGSLTSPETMGGYGAGTTIWWTDPKHDLTFVGLMTGVMNGDANYVRWRRLSDIAVSACV